MSAPQKAVLMCVADRADDQGLAWPSIPGICEWTCLSRTAVIGALKWLERTGLVSIAKVTGKNNRCTIDLEKVRSDPCVSHTRAPDAPVRVEHPTSAPEVPPPVRQTDYTRAPDAPEASESIIQASGKHQKTRASKSRSLPEGFTISERVRTWAEEKGFAELEAHLEYFVSYAKASGKKYVDWDEALMNAIRGNWAKVKGNALQTLEAGNLAAANRWAAAGAAIFDVPAAETPWEKRARQKMEQFAPSVAAKAPDIFSRPTARSQTIDVEVTDVSARNLGQ
jgi:hypothetical protein